MKYRTRIFAGALALACLVAPVAAQNPGLAPGGSLYGNSTTASAPPSFSRTPVLGIPGSVLGQIGFGNLTSGTVTLRPQTGALGTNVLTLPAVTGTLATTAGATIPSVAQGDLLYGSAVNVLSTLAKDTSATRYLSNAGTTNNPAWAQVNLTNGVTGVLPGANGGTGVANSGKTITLGGNLMTSGAFNSTFTMTGTTGVTFPTTGTLATTATANVASVSNSDGTLTISPTTGAVVASLNLAHANTWSALQTFAPGALTTGMQLTTTAAAAFIGQTNTGSTWLIGPTTAFGATGKGWGLFSNTAGAYRITYDDDGVGTFGAATISGAALRLLNSAGTFSLNLGGNLTTSGAASLPAIAQGDLWYGSASGTISALTKSASASQFLKNSGTSNNPAWASVTAADITGAALTKTDDTNVTLTLGGSPTTALLNAASLTLGWTGQLGLTRGGTAASLTASNGGIIYSTASAMAVLSGTATARQMLQSGASTTPAWSTTTWPATTSVDRILYSSSANVIGEITTANSGVLITSSGGTPSISTTIPSATQDNITRTGTLVSGATGAGFTIALGTSTLTGDLPFANLTQGSARSVLGVAGNATADFASVQGSAGQILGVPAAGTSLAFTAAPVLGTAGTTGTLGLAGTTSGTATITPQATAGTPTLTLPNASGTFAVSVSAPLALSATTGNLTVTGAAGQVLAGSTPAFTATPVLGVAGSTVGTLGFQNATSGTITLSPPTGALGTVTLSLPAATDTLVGKATTDTLTNKSISGLTNTITNVSLTTGVTGNLPVTNLNSGTSASSSTYWRGDGTWSTPAGAGDFVGPASATDKAAVRFNSTTGKLGQNSALIIADTTGSLSRSGNGGIPLQGTNTNDNAAAGYVGELIESTVLTGAAVSLTTATPANITSVSLTAGDWDCWTNAVYNVDGATAVDYVILSMGTTSATLSTAPNGGGYALANPGAATIAGYNVSQHAFMRVSVSGTTTFYSVSQSAFTVNTTAVYGYLGCRRVR